jgi:hypothetical protein
MSRRHNNQVEATAPSRCRFECPMFYSIIVPGGAAFPGAVPHLGRWAMAIHALVSKSDPRT